MLGRDNYLVNHIKNIVVPICRKETCKDSFGLALKPQAFLSQVATATKQDSFALLWKPCLSMTAFLSRTPRLQRQVLFQTSSIKTMSTSVWEWKGTGGFGGCRQPGRRGEAMKTAEVVEAPSSPGTRIWGLRIAWHSMTSSMPASKSNSEVSSSAESMAYILSDRTPMVQGQAASQSQVDQHDVNHGLGVKECLGSRARALGGWCWVKHPKL